MDRDMPDRARSRTPLRFPGLSPVPWTDEFPSAHAASSRTRSSGGRDRGWKRNAVVANGGHYFLFYSGNNWKSSAYGVGVAVCTGPLGPCSKPLSGPILGTGSNIQGPGGASVFVDGTGSFWIAFHAWSPGAVGFPNNRSLYLRRLVMTGATPIVQP
jgi:hypothetical protein